MEAVNIPSHLFLSKQKRSNEFGTPERFYDPKTIVETDQFGNYIITVKLPILWVKRRFLTNYSIYVFDLGE